MLVIKGHVMGISRNPALASASSCINHSHPTTQITCMSFASSGDFFSTVVHGSMVVTWALYWFNTVTIIILDLSLRAETARYSKIAVAAVTLVATTGSSTYECILSELLIFCCTEGCAITSRATPFTTVAGT
jgi:hypothetical protein